MQAYDTLFREKLYRTMNHFEIPQKLIRLYQLILWKTLTAVAEICDVDEISLIDRTTTDLQTVFGRPNNEVK